MKDFLKSIKFDKNLPKYVWNFIEYCGTYLKMFIYFYSFIGNNYAKLFLSDKSEWYHNCISLMKQQEKAKSIQVLWVLKLKLAIT